MKKKNALAYLENHFTNMPPGQVVLALYDGTLAALQHAMDAFDEGDVARRGAAITKAVAILGELQVALNLEEGPHQPLAVSLDALYHYMMYEISNANMHDKREPLAECSELISGIREAWSKMLVTLSEEEAVDRDPETNYV
jgi:flagellar protein FliS